MPTNFNLYEVPRDAQGFRTDPGDTSVSDNTLLADHTGLFYIEYSDADVQRFSYTLDTSFRTNGVYLHSFYEPALSDITVESYVDPSEVSEARITYQYTPSSSGNGWRFF